MDVFYARLSRSVEPVISQRGHTPHKSRRDTRATTFSAERVAAPFVKLGRGKVGVYFAFLLAARGVADKMELRPALRVVSPARRATERTPG
jgi:hypothetical protein